MIGQKFGRWTVVARATKARHWACVCQCGSERDVFDGNLKTGLSKSCGCLRAEMSSDRFRVHGDKNSSEYVSWLKMRQRCLNKNNRFYGNYGGRGITICSKWKDSFCAFLADMGRKPTPAHTLDRIDPGGNYEPSNCRWATRKEQNRNTRTCLPVVRSDGEIFSSVAEAAEAVDGTWYLVATACRRERTYLGYRWRFTQ